VSVLEEIKVDIAEKRSAQYKLDYKRDAIMRSKQVVYWPGFVTRRHSLNKNRIKVTRL
jgi:hypothetical protein